MKAIECSNTTDSGFDSGLVVFLWGLVLMDNIKKVRYFIGLFEKEN